MLGNVVLAYPLLDDSVKVVHLADFLGEEAKGYYIVSDTRIFSTRQGKLKEIKGVRRHDGYVSLQFGRGGKREYLHRLLCIAFLNAPADEQFTTVFKDGNKRNIALSNLSWVKGRLRPKNRFELKKAT